MNYFGFDIYEAITGLFMFGLTGLFIGFLVLGVLRHMVFGIMERRE